MPVMINPPSVIGTYAGDLALDEKALASCVLGDLTVAVSFRIDPSGALRDVAIDDRLSKGAQRCIAKAVKQQHVEKPTDGPVDVVFELVYGTGGPIIVAAADDQLKGVSRVTAEPDPAGHETAGWGTIGTGRYGTIGHGNGTCCDSLADVKPVKAKPVRPPRITIGEPAMSGDYNPIFVKRFFKRHRDAFDHCLDTHAGSATVRLTISKSGKVTSSSASGDHAECLAREAAQIEFSKPNAETRVAVPVAIAPR